MLPLKGLLDAALKLAPPPRDDVRDEGRGVKFRKENGHANEEVEAYDLLLFSPPLQREESTSMDTTLHNTPVLLLLHMSPTAGWSPALCIHRHHVKKRTATTYLSSQNFTKKKEKYLFRNKLPQISFPFKQSFPFSATEKENPRKQRIHIYLYSWHPRKPII